MFLLLSVLKTFIPRGEIEGETIVRTEFVKVSYHVSITKHFATLIVVSYYDFHASTGAFEGDGEAFLPQRKMVVMM